MKIVNMFSDSYKSPRYRRRDPFRPDRFSAVFSSARCSASDLLPPETGPACRAVGFHDAGTGRGSESKQRQWEEPLEEAAPPGTMPKWNLSNIYYTITFTHTNTVHRSLFSPTNFRLSNIFPAPSHGHQQETSRDGPHVLHQRSHCAAQDSGHAEEQRQSWLPWAVGRRNRGADLATDLAAYLSSV